MSNFDSTTAPVDIKEADIRKIDAEFERLFDLADLAYNVLVQAYKDIENFHQKHISSMIEIHSCVGNLEYLPSQKKECRRLNHIRYLADCQYQAAMKDLENCYKKLRPMEGIEQCISMNSDSQ